MMMPRKAHFQVTCLTSIFFLACVSPQGFAQEKQETSSLSSLTKTLLCSLGGAAAGAAAGGFSAPKNADRVETIANVSLNALGGAIVSGAVCYFIWKNEASHVYDRYNTLLEAHQQLQQELKRKHQKPAIDNTPQSPLDLEAVVSKFSDLKTDTSLDLSHCKKKTYRLFLTPQALAQDAKLISHELIPEIAYDPYLAIEVRFRFSSEGCFQPNLSDNNYLNVHWPGMDRYLLTIIKKKINDKYSQSGDENQ